MAFTTIAYAQAVDPAGAYVQLAAPNDPHVTVNTPRILVPTLDQVVAVAAQVETAVAPRARLVAPSLLERARFQIVPFNGGAGGGVLPGTPQAVADLRQTPIQLVKGEALTAEILSNPAVSQSQSVVVWLADGPIAPVVGPAFTVRATATTTLVVNSWTNVSLTFDEDLPRGRYQVVGFRPESTGMIAGRLVFVGGGFRPGALGCDVGTDIQNPMFRMGGMGSYGEFEDVEPPTVDCLALTADTAEVFFLDLIQIRKGPG